MATSVDHSTDRRHRELADVQPRMAKAHVRKAEMASEPDFRALVGRAIQRAASLVGWSLKELAARAQHDPRQVARWIDGKERPHFDALFAVEELRQPLAVALAELAECEVRTVIEIRRIA